MGKNFANAAKNVSKRKLTENGAPALKTTSSKVLNMFAMGGALRTRIDDVPDMTEAAWNENPDLTMKMAFYLRDREAVGERDTGRAMLRWIAMSYPTSMKKNLGYVPEFGRWDDIYVFIGTPVANAMWKMVKAQFNADYKAMTENKPCSLLAKWLKSVNTSSKESCRLGRLTAKHLGMTTIAYQRTLARLRKHINVVEVKMSNNKWEDIKYESVPSRAMKNYGSAFAKHDYEGFNSYIQQVNAGIKTIKANGLFPYDLVSKYTNRYSKLDKVVEAQWKALPNYIEGEHNVIVMADTSGSMTGYGASAPINSAIGLAIYFAERNSGPYHNLFMTFSQRPEFINLNDGTLHQKVNTAMQADWGMNTNIKKAFQLILNTAVNNNLSSDELPKALVIVSDMEFDPYNCKGTNSFEAMKNLYASHGYTLPHLVFWCVNSRNNTVHSNYNDYCTTFSGSAASTFRDVLSTIGMNAYEAMLKVLNSERYSMISA